MTPVNPCPSLVVSIKSILNRSGLWKQGVYSHFCDTRESPPLYGLLVFGKPFLLYHRSAFPTMRPSIRNTPLDSLLRTKQLINQLLGFTTPAAGLPPPSCEACLLYRRSGPLRQQALRAVAGGDQRPDLSVFVSLLV